MDKITIIFNKTQITISQQTTIKALIEKYSLAKSGSGYYRIKDENKIVIERSSFIIEKNQKITHFSANAEFLNNITGFAIKTIIKKNKTFCIKNIDNFIWDATSFQIDYWLAVSEKTKSSQFIKIKLAQLIKKSKYIIIPIKNGGDSIGNDNSCSSKQISHMYCSTLLCRFFLITDNHALDISTTKEQASEKLIRIRGTCKRSSAELEQLLVIRKSQKKSDHRELNKDLPMFLFDQDIGSGFPIILEHGVFVENKIEEYFRNSSLFSHAKFIRTPIFGRKELYIRSGHWENYHSAMFPPIILDGKKEELILRPMTCPHHCIVFKQQHYQDNQLPITYCENASLFRYESSGALLGLERTRQMKLFDSHTFVQLEKQEIIKILRRELAIVEQVLADFKIKISYFRLSINNLLKKQKFVITDGLWENANAWLEQAVVEQKISYQKEEGHAAFYGPKIDIQIKTAIGVMITIATIQLDLGLAKKLACTYGNKKYPAIIHSGFIGTFERFLSILLEQNRGFLPFWCNPFPIIIIPLADKFHNEATILQNILQKNQIKSTIDFSTNHLNLKIKDAYKKKANFFTVIGKRESDTKVYHFKSPQTGKIYQKDQKQLASILHD